MTAASTEPRMERRPPPKGPRLRIDDIDLSITRGGVDAGRGATTLTLSPERPVIAARPTALPVFEGWIAAGELHVGISGLAAEPMELAVDLGHGAVGATTKLEPKGEADPATGALPFACTLAVPLGAIRASLGQTVELALTAWSPLTPALPARRIPLVTVSLALIPSRGPSIQAIDLSDVTDAELYGGSERRSFDLGNPEEGFWRGSGRALLRLNLTWTATDATSGFTLETKIEKLTHAFTSSGALVEDVSQRSASPTTTRAELVFDTGHDDLGAIPEEGKDVALGLTATHALSFFAKPGEEARAHLVWRAPFAIRVRDVRPMLKTFHRLSAVGIDFGTSATVAALVQRGYRSLLQLGRPADDVPAQSSRGDESVRAAENPAVLLVDDHEQLWARMSEPGRFPYLVRVLRGSHAALAKATEAPNSVVGQLKSLPERVLGLDESPQLRDRERQRDFLLDEARVRALVRSYAYLLGRAINRPGQDVYLHYVLTYPSKTDAKIKKLIEDELRAGLLLSFPSDIPAEELRVEAVASEAEAFAAEVCPELCAHPDLAPLLEKHGELRFVVFDLGGGTLDVACGRFRPATEPEQAEFGSSTVIETLQVNGLPDLGGDVLTHELAWLVHQHPSVLPEMEAKEVPMMRPITVPINHLARRPELYKRGLAARQNWLRIERALGLERVKYGPTETATPAPNLTLTRIDGTEATIESLGGDLGAITETLRKHLVSRIREGVKLVVSTIASAAWPAPAGQTEPETAKSSGSIEERGIVVLLAGNSSRSAFVAQTVAEELGLADAQKGEAFRAWRPEGDGSAPFRSVVLYETLPRNERGTTIVGVTPKTAVALGALKLASHEVHLVRATQGFGYFLGDLRGFPPKFTALVPMGAPSGPPDQPGPHIFDFGRWDTKMPLRVAREYVPNKMTSNDPRVFLVPTGLPPGHVGRLYVAVVSPDEVVLCLDRAPGGAAPSSPETEPLTSHLYLSKALR
ncbi:MAG: hypothetical protein U0271_45220 [Polyangiaceae bacterium]